MYQLPNMLPCPLKTILAFSSNGTAQRLVWWTFCCSVEKVWISQSLLSVLSSHNGNKERNYALGEWLRSLQWWGGLLPSLSLKHLQLKEEGGAAALLQT